MKQLAIIAGVFLIIYLKIIYSSFISKGDNGENFFTLRNSQSLNKTFIYGNLTGIDVRALSKQLSFPIQPQNDLILPTFENYRKEVSLEQSLYLKKTPLEFQISRFYEETLEIFEKSLNSEKCMESQGKLGFSGMSQYYMEDNNYLRMVALWKYLINPEYDQKQNSGGNQFNFTEGYLIQQKFQEFQISQSQSISQELTMKQLVSYISELMLNCQRFEKYRFSKTYRNQPISTKSNWKFNGVKYRVPDNGYDMFYKEVLGNKFILDKTENIMQTLYKGYVRQLAYIYQNVDQILSPDAKASLLEVIEHSNFLPILYNMKFSQHYEIFDNSDLIFNCFGPILGESCQNCLIRLMHNSDLQLLFDINLTSQAIALHSEWLQFEEQANFIKHIMKWIYITGLSCSFMASFYLIDRHARKEQAKQEIKPKKFKEDDQAEILKSQQEIDNMFKQYLEPEIEQMKKGKQVRGIEELLGEKLAKKYK